MKTLKLSLVALATTLVLAPQAQASNSDRTFGQIYSECGIGGMIFTENGTAAAISNIIWDLGTTAVSSNISSPGNCEGGQAKMAAFIDKSYDKLEAEIATGEGQYIQTLAKMSNKDISTIRADFAKIVSSSDYTSLTKYQKVEKLYNITAI